MGQIVTQNNYYFQKKKSNRGGGEGGRKKVSLFHNNESHYEHLNEWLFSSFKNFGNRFSVYNSMKIINFSKLQRQS